MIHINRGDGKHEILTDAEARLRYPGIFRPSAGVWLAIGGPMKESRNAAGMTVREMAKALNVKMSVVSAIETGDICPTRETVGKWETAVAGRVAS